MRYGNGSKWAISPMMRRRPPSTLTTSHLSQLRPQLECADRNLAWRQIGLGAEPADLWAGGTGVHRVLLSPYR